MEQTVQVKKHTPSYKPQLEQIEHIEHIGRKGHIGQNNNRTSKCT